MEYNENEFAGWLMDQYPELIRNSDDLIRHMEAETHIEEFLAEQEDAAVDHHTNIFGG